MDSPIFSTSCLLSILGGVVTSSPFDMLLLSRQCVYESKLGARAAQQVYQQGKRACRGTSSNP